MSGEVQSKREAAAARYNLSAQPEWQQFLNHFDLSENFALVVLLVADADGAEQCRVELEKQLQQDAKQLVSLDISDPDKLRNLPSQLLAMQLPPNVTGLWIAAVEPDYSPNFPAWKEAWQFALARLNPRRNEIRRRFNCSLIFAGAPWLQETMREVAPDIWSVRTLVARIEPIEPQALSGPKAGSLVSLASDEYEAESSGDPVFALQEAAKIRGVPGKELTRALLLDRAGKSFEAINDFISAENAYTEALELKRKVGAPPDSQLATLLQLSWVCQRLGQLQRTIDHSQTALALARETGNRDAESGALGFLGLAYADLGEPRKALEFHEQTLGIARETGNRLQESRALGNLGITYALLGDWRRAIELYNQQLETVRQIGDKQGEGNALGNLGGAYIALGDARKAIEFHEQALAVMRELGDKQAQGNILGNLGVTYFTLGDLPKSIKLAEERLGIARELGDHRGEGTALGNLGNIYAVSGDMHKAVGYYDRQLSLAREIGDPYGESKGLWNSALAIYKLGGYQEAITRAEAALKVFEALGDTPSASVIRTALNQWRGQKQPQ